MLKHVHVVVFILKFTAFCTYTDSSKSWKIYAEKKHGNNWNQLYSYETGTMNNPIYYIYTVCETGDVEVVESYFFMLHYVFSHWQRGLSYIRGTQPSI